MCTMFIEKIELTKFKQKTNNSNDKTDVYSRMMVNKTRSKTECKDNKTKSLSTSIFIGNLDDILNNNNEDVYADNIDVENDQIKDNNNSELMESANMSLSNNEINQVAEEKTNIIVNYLPQNMRQDELLKIFSSIGPIESCKLIRDKMTGQSLSYGFINFTNPQDAKTAIEKLNGLQIENKIIKVSLARPSSEMIKGANLYVGSVPRNYKQDKLRELFSICGTIITCRVLTDTYGKSKGVAFIRFDKRKEAEKAIDIFNGKIIEDGSIALVVKLANTPFNLLNPKSKSMPKSTTIMPNGVNGKPLLSPVKASQSMPMKDIGRPVVICNSQPTIPGMVWRSVFIEPMRQNFPTSALSLPKISNLNNEPEYICTRPMFTESISTSNDSSNSCTFSSTPFHPSFPILPLNTLESFNQNTLTPLVPFTCIPCTNQTTASISDYGFRNWIIFVNNLSQDTTDDNIWQLFNPFGAVQSVFLSKDLITNTCSGYGFVQMINYNEAVLAVQCLNGTLFGDRVMYVNLRFY